jgi:hypothetical protein
VIALRRIEHVEHCNVLAIFELHHEVLGLFFFLLFFARGVSGFLALRLFLLFAYTDPQREPEPERHG